MLHNKGLGMNMLPGKAPFHALSASSENVDLAHLAGKSAWSACTSIWCGVLGPEHARRPPPSISLPHAAHRGAESFLVRTLSTGRPWALSSGSRAIREALNRHVTTRTGVSAETSRRDSQRRRPVTTSHSRHRRRNTARSLRADIAWRPGRNRLQAVLKTDRIAQRAAGT
jgi:hypothetical protein